MDILKSYVDLFNKNDEEIYINLIDNNHAYEWLKEEIPLLECPDKDIEEAYYFRWWTFRKHLKHTEDGYVFTEFLPKVPWSGKHNTINAPLGHHIHEGRWLKNAKKYFTDYINFFLDNPDGSHQYSTWFIYSVYQYCRVTGDFDLGDDFLKKACKYYEEWENTHLLPNGMFWSYDDYDAMEYSISGTTEDLRVLKGIRPTLNSYMCADAWAIIEFAKIYNNWEVYEKYKKKHEELKSLINEKLWQGGFYRAFHFEENENLSEIFKKNSPKEEIGYIPWMFNIPEEGKENVFDYLTDENVFYTDFGISTAEKTHDRYLYEVNHNCLWNGYVWPYATAQTLTAMRNVSMKYPKYKDSFFALTKQYAKSHKRVREDGKTVPWIDEVRHPQKDEWSSREILKNKGWKQESGGYERGKDYNHSTFCDIIISGIIGVQYENNELTVSPLVSDGWDWFKLENLNFRGNTYTIIYDKTGEKYKLGKGIVILKK